jgi:hypothetical protein
MIHAQMLNTHATDRAFEKGLIEDYNSNLSAGVKRFKAAHHGVETWLFDANDAFSQILDHPTKVCFYTSSRIAEC